MLRAALLLLLAGRRAAAGAGSSAWRVPTAEIAGGDLTKLQYFAGALSPAECAAVRGLAGREQTAGIATDGGDVSRTKVRSTDLRWLARGEETEWLYERMLALAEAANWDWGYKDLDAMQELQLGVYDAAAAQRANMESTWMAPSTCSCTYECVSCARSARSTRVSPLVKYPPASSPPAPAYCCNSESFPPSATRTRRLGHE